MAFSAFAIKVTTQQMDTAPSYGYQIPAAPATQLQASGFTPTFPSQPLNYPVPLFNMVRIVPSNTQSQPPVEKVTAAGRQVINPQEQELAAVRTQLHAANIEIARLRQELVEKTDIITSFSAGKGTRRNSTGSYASFAASWRFSRRTCRAPSTVISRRRPRRRWQPEAISRGWSCRTASMRCACSKPRSNEGSVLRPGRSFQPAVNFATTSG